MLRQQDALREDVQRTVNRLEKANSTSTPQEVIRSLERTKSWLNEELARIEKLITDHTDNDPGLKADLDLLKSIKGVKRSGRAGDAGVAKRQDVQKRLTGGGLSGTDTGRENVGELSAWQTTYVKNRASGVRAKLYVAALTASRWNKQAKAIYERLVAKGKAKKAALGAVMRKLVHLCFGVLKTRLPWDENM